MAKTRDILSSRTVQLRKHIDEEKQMIKMTPDEKKDYLSKLRDEHNRNETYKSKILDEPPQSQEISMLQDLIRKQVAKNKQHEDGINTL